MKATPKDKRLGWASTPPPDPASTAVHRPSLAVGIHAVAGGVVRAVLPGAGVGRRGERVRRDAGGDRLLPHPPGVPQRPET